MECRLCKVRKLSNEFPPWKLTEQCNHANSYCMRCVIAYVQREMQCPDPSCGQKVSPDNTVVQRFQRTLDEMFRVYSTESTPFLTTDESGQAGVRIALLNGDSITVNYDPNMTIQEMKELIKSRLNHEVQKQKLLYNDKELKVLDTSGKQMTLNDHHLKPNSTIYLVVLMFAIPDNFDHVVFDLYWGYPASGRDYLDAACYHYSGNNFAGLVDYRNCGTNYGWIEHSGDVLDESNRIGHHTIHVQLKKIPRGYTHLFFTLSAWNAPDISEYRNPSLKFYEADKPDINLCETTFSHALHSQAVIMCSLSRTSEGWKIYELRTLSSGNLKNPRPLLNTIASSFKQLFMNHETPQTRLYPGQRKTHINSRSQMP